jgi:hypothetical protein
LFPHLARRDTVSQHTRRSRSVNPSEPSDNEQPPSEDFPFGQNVEPASSPDAAATEPKPLARPLIPGIDLDSVALEEDYQESVAAEDAPTTVVVRKASGMGYFRAHPDLWKNVRMMEVKNGPDRGFYLVAGSAKTFLLSDDNDDVKLFPARLTLCYARDCGLFLWPLRLPEPRRNNQLDEWSQSALRICKIAEEKWVKLYTRKGGSCYSHKLGEGIRAEPAWPAMTLNEVAGLAFEGKYLDDPNDPLIRRLLGKE